MNAVEIISKKRDGQKLSKDEISSFISQYLIEKIPEYQMAALLMAICLNGMDYEETGWLTDVMLNSGKIIKFPEPDFIYVDKHSTGGVGDKVSLILAPWVASCGVKVPMLSGRGLGHTGGTLDKLESIPGFRTNLSLEKFQSAVERVGCVITGQTEEIAPADKRMYALRDVTGSVESIPLICGSILSKKLAAGPRGLVFDVKCGNGAFMKSISDARVLAENLTGVSKSLGRGARALITDMNQPLGKYAGNLLEVIETIEFLRGNYSRDLYEVTLELSIEMLILSRQYIDAGSARNALIEKLKSGKAYDKFAEMVVNQKGDLDRFENKLPMNQCKAVIPIASDTEGYIQGFDTLGIGRLIVDLGGGRKRIEDKIDHLIGIEFHKKIGDLVKSGEIIAMLHTNTKSSAENESNILKRLIKIGREPVEVPRLIKERIY
jgi:pyrimidine-nucleoside phosphorylase